MTDKQYKTVESVLYILCGVVLPITIVMYAIVS